MNNVEKLSAALSAAGICVYPPAAHRGVCSSPYCVVYRAGSAFSRGSRTQGWVRYRVVMLVPAHSPALLGELYESVREAVMPLTQSGELAPEAPLGAIMADEELLALSGHCDYIAWYANA